ncbi:MAG: 4-(cytidine 5'-diphospho)-2-C-methyl-D-erythritol kinase [Alphaproteobacteria bacterium]|nr:4-(cytidine 5'-diphospho)-2-C-methyl-D-erythritol kinase [Alphaproteobacteria bacterium]
MIQTYTYKAKAKLNLFLHVLATADDGFHELQSLVYFPNIYDELSFSITAAEANIITVADKFAEYLPTWQDNSIYKVISFFQETFAIKEKIQVNLQKNLPIGGGIGGGSSNTAIAITAMNDLFNLKLPSAKILEIAKSFGSDVPVCLYQKQGGAIFEGKGELVKSASLPEIPILLINPMQPLLTGSVFKKYDEAAHQYSKKINHLDYLNFKDLSSLLDFLKNTKNNLTAASMMLNKNISGILAGLKESGAELSRMSGSGSTCFAIYKNNQDLEAAYKKLKILYPNYWIAISKENRNI